MEERQNKRVEREQIKKIKMLNRQREKRKQEEVKIEKVKRDKNLNSKVAFIEKGKSNKRKMRTLLASPPARMSSFT